ncbi:MAG: metal-dependent hydrolase [Candidatus Thermoplasmatota archaeon]|nr:metal-dependent hydrolase [Candidatus Thermoplasmatota archaeon]
MKVTWLGHAAFLLEGKDRILVDPFLSGNPMASMKAEDVECDIVCVTHAHGDHYGDAVAIAKGNDAPIVAIYEVATMAQALGPDIVGMNIGGSTKVGDTRITMTNAIHSSCFVGDGKIEAGGNPAGFVIDSGSRVYHSGDTGVFGDMRLIGELYEPELALLPIGDFYTMGIREATKAVELLSTPTVIPMHYNTFEAIQQDPREFKNSVSMKTSSEAVILKPGESYSLG